MIYFCPTPIGNLSDITMRTLEVFEKVDVIACEDTRVTMKLLSHFELKKQLIAYHKFNEQEKAKELIELSKEKDIALVSDAGMPGISDPGAILAVELIKSGVEFCVLPGANAANVALICSGLNTDHFLFYGFLNSKSSARVKELESLKSFPYTMIFYEAPHRILKVLEDMKDVFGDRNVSVSRELTKMYETTYRGKISEVMEQIFEKGEFVIVVEGNTEEEVFDIKALLLKKISSGIKPSQAVKQVSSETGINKNEVYKVSLELKENGDA